MLRNDDQQVLKENCTSHVFVEKVVDYVVKVVIYLVQDVAKVDVEIIIEVEKIVIAKVPVPKEI